MGNNSICPEAIRWALKNTSYKSFTEMLRECPHFRNIISRGGFKLNGGSFRENNTVQRLVAKISSDPDFARMVMIYNGQIPDRFIGVGDCYLSFDKKWMRQNWREFLRALKDPRPMVLAFLADSSNKQMRRIGEIIAGQKRFWVDDAKESPNTDKIRKRIRSCVVRRALSYLALKTLEQPAPAQATAPQMPPAPTAPVAPTVAATPVAPTTPVQGLLPLLPLTPPAVATPAPVAPVAEAPKPQSEGTRVAELKRELAAVRKQAKADAEKAAEELKEKNKQLNAMQKRLNEVDASFDGALKELSAEKDRQVDEAMALYEQNLFGLNPDTKLFARELAEKNANLDERFKNAIRRQKECDRKNGTTSYLRMQREKLARYLKQLGDIIDDAIVVEPEVVALQKEIDAQLKEVDKRLRETSTITPHDYEIFPDRLHTYIKSIQVDNLDEADKKFDQVAAWLDGALPRDVLSDEERKELTIELQRRRKYVRTIRHRENEKARREEARAAAVAKGDINAEEAQRATGMFDIPEVTEFSSHLRELKEIELYIDAYNVIKRDPVWSLMEREVGGFKKAREDFSARVKNIAYHFKHVTIVFDSEMITETSDQPNQYTTVIWAPKHNNDQNADNYIVNRLTDLADRECEDDLTADNYKKRWIVTEDFKLIARLDDADCCGAYVANRALTSLLHG